jgi:hypothetical protein
MTRIGRMSTSRGTDPESGRFIVPRVVANMVTRFGQQQRNSLVICLQENPACIFLQRESYAFPFGI